MESPYFILSDHLPRIISLLKVIPPENVKQILPYIGKSKSQLAQDLMVLSVLNFKEDGFFVEFGATNGKNLSNTFLLEKEFDWKGVLAEPARIWQRELKAFRECMIFTKCVYPISGDLIDFSEDVYPELSGSTTHLEIEREPRRKYKVESISLYDLLLEANAPKIIDYISVDTEGSELSIFQGFDFDSFRFRVITIEHNNRNDAAEILSIFVRNGYTQIYSDISDIEFWFVSHSINTLIKDI